MRSLACLLAFAVLAFTAVRASESVTPEQALELVDSLAANPELLPGRHLLQSGPLSHQLAVCRQLAAEGKLCPAIAHYLSVCRAKFGVHTLKCSSSRATACVSSAYSVSSTGKCVCSKGYEHYYGVCIACPAGKVKNVVSYGQCRTCALGKYQPARGQATCLKCDITRYRVNKARSSCTLRSAPTPTPGTTPTPTPKTPTPTKAPTTGPTAPTATPIPSAMPTFTSFPPPGVKAPPSPVTVSPPSPATMPPPAPVMG